jgi:hypothetical protein
MKKYTTAPLIEEIAVYRNKKVRKNLRPSILALQGCQMV